MLRQRFTGVVLAVLFSASALAQFPAVGPVFDKEPQLAQKVSVDWTNGATLDTLSSWLSEQGINFMIDPEIVSKLRTRTMTSTNGNSTSTWEEPQTVVLMKIQDLYLHEAMHVIARALKGFWTKEANVYILNALPKEMQGMPMGLEFGASSVTEAAAAAPTAPVEGPAPAPWGEFLSERQRLILRSRGYLKTTDLSRFQLNSIPKDTFEHRLGQTIKLSVYGDDFKLKVVPVTK